MVANYFKNLLRALFPFFFSSVEEVEEKGESRELIAVVQALIEDHKSEREFFKQWLTGYNQPSNEETRRSYIEEEIQRDLEDAARLGNSWAADIVASDEAMADYIKSVKDSY